jgi:hypothetical protein
MISAIGALHMATFASRMMVVVSLAAPLMALAVKSAEPDPTLVSRYEANDQEFRAKVAECRAKKDLAEVLTDAGCASAQEVALRKRNANLSNRCRVSDLYVVVPQGLKDEEIRKYLQAHTPSDEALQRCKKEKAQWLQEQFESATKK